MDLAAQIPIEQRERFVKELEEIQVSNNHRNKNSLIQWYIYIYIFFLDRINLCDTFMFLQC